MVSEEILFVLILLFGSIVFLVGWWAFGQLSSSSVEYVMELDEKMRKEND